MQYTLTKNFQLYPRPGKTNRTQVGRYYYLTKKESATTLKQVAISISRIANQHLFNARFSETNVLAHGDTAHDLLHDMINKYHINEKDLAKFLHATDELDSDCD